MITYDKAIEAAAQYEVEINDDVLGSLRVLLAKGLIAHRAEQGVEIDLQMRQDAIGAAYEILQAATTAFTEKITAGSEVEGVVKTLTGYDDKGGRFCFKQAATTIQALVAEVAGWRCSVGIALYQVRCCNQRAEAAEAERDRLRELVLTYGEMPFPCHDHMSKEHWEAICRIVSAFRLDQHQ